MNYDHNLAMERSLIWQYDTTYPATQNSVVHKSQNVFKLTLVAEPINHNIRYRQLFNFSVFITILSFFDFT